MLYEGRNVEIMINLCHSPARRNTSRDMWEKVWFLSGEIEIRHVIRSSSAANFCGAIGAVTKECRDCQYMFWAFSDSRQTKRKLLFPLSSPFLPHSHCQILGASLETHLLLRPRHWAKTCGCIKKIFKNKKRRSFARWQHFVCKLLVIL